MEHISFAYHGLPQVHEDLNFSLSQGQRVGILGANGAGKSTMFLLAMGLLKPGNGRLLHRGKECRREADLRNLRREVGLLFQDPDDQLFCPTVAEDVAFGPRNLGLTKEESLERVDQTLDNLGLGGYQKRITYQLSGGEKRLVSLASVLAMHPTAILLDEPSIGLDEKHTALLERHLLDSDLSWAIISHDRSFLDRTCTSLLKLDDGRLLAA